MEIIKFEKMKKILFSLLILAVSVLAVQAQCGEVLLKQALKEMGNGQYIKDYPVDLVKEKKDSNTGYVKYSIILNSRSQYRFTIINGTSNSESVIAQLYDGERLLATNYDGGKMYKSFEVVIGKTKVYNLVFSFKGGAEGCASAVQSLVKQFTAEEMK